jgi:hypothetical protein
MTDLDAFGHVIFCDDARQEVGGKLTFVGVYQTLLFVNQDFPVSLTKLVLSIHYSERLGIDAKTTSISISMPGDPDDQPSWVGQLPMADIHRAPRLSSGEDQGLPPPQFINVITQIVLAPCQLKSPGLISVTVRRGDEIIHLGRLRILRAPTTPANEAGIALIS